MSDPTEVPLIIAGQSAELAGELRPGLTYRFPAGGASQPELYSVRFRVTRRCNRSCRFCFIPHQAPPLGEQDVAAGIAEAIRAGARKVVLTGGEPTLHEGLGDLVAAARRQGARWVDLQSNGILLAQRDRCRRLIDAGVTSVTVSLPAHREPRLEQLTGVPGSLPKILQALENLAELGMDTNVTHVLGPQNVAEVGAFTRFLWERRLCRKLCFLFAAPIVPELARPELILRFSDGVGPLRDALAYCLECSVPFDGLSERCGLPECLLAGDERYYGGAVRLVDANRAHDFLDAPACGVCARREHCYRVRALYAYLYGLAEFRPVVEPGVLGEAPAPTQVAAERLTAVTRSAGARTPSSSPAPPVATPPPVPPADEEPADPVMISLAHVGERLALGHEAIEALAQLDTHWSTAVEIRQSDGRGIEVPAWRARYGIRQGPSVGALEISAHLDPPGCRSAAIFRGLRAAAFGLPIGGAHGGLRCDPAAVSREALAQAVAHFLVGLGATIEGPGDCITPHTSVSQDVLHDAFRSLPVDATTRVRLLRGKPLDKEGRVVRMPAVSSAVAAALFTSARYRQPAAGQLRYAIWGFGRAGQRIASLLAAGDHPARLVGAVDSRSACVCPAGLDPDALRLEKRKQGRLPDRHRAEPAEVLSADVDLLFLTSRTAPFDSTTADAVRARAVVDMTATVSSGTELALLSRDCFFVPAVVATAGPVVAAAMEIEADGSPLPFTAVERRIAATVGEVLPAMLGVGRELGLSMTDSLMALGVRALSAATKA